VEAAEPPKSVWTVASEGSSPPTKVAVETRSKPRAIRRRVVRAPLIVRFKPTYVVDLREVPWPYNVWYRHAR
jgi:hypothetical protein